jgi:hypothetical protein
MSELDFEECTGYGKQFYITDRRSPRCFLCGMTDMAETIIKPLTDLVCLQ